MTALSKLTLPPIGSLWRARDGRLVQVTEHAPAIFEGEQDAAHVAVLNAGRYQHAFSTFRTRSFGIFLKPEPKS